MNHKYNWNNLDGAKFQSLIQELLYYEEPNSKSFGRPGPDGGIDTITSDRKHVFQMKYIESFKMSDAIKRAKEELDKIKKYKQKGHRNYKLWKDVKKWTLIGTIEDNSNDEDKWNNKIVDKYKCLGLTIDYWTIADIEAKLDRYEFIADSYFNSINRCIVTLDSWKSLKQKEPFGQNFANYPFTVCKDNLSSLIEFIISDEQFLFIQGYNLIGKSRFLYECGKNIEEKNDKVFVGLPNIMNDSDTWIKYFKDYNEERYLLIDEPSFDLIKKIYELFPNVNLKSWKVIIIVSKTIDDCQYYEYVNRTDTKLINLKPLTKKQSYDLIDSYNSGFREKTKFKVYKLSNGIPGLIDIILTYFCRKNYSRLNNFNLYKNIFKVIKDDLNDNQLKVLRYISAWKIIIDDDNEKQIDYLKKLIGTDEEGIRKLLHELVSFGLINEWKCNEANYSCEVPIIRFSVLVNWFIKINSTTNEFKPSREFESFIKELLNEDVPRKNKIIDSLVELFVFEDFTTVSNLFGTSLFNVLEKTLNSDNIKTLEIIQLSSIVETICVISLDNTFKIIDIILRKQIKDYELVHPIFGKIIYNKSLVYSKIIDILERLIIGCYERKYIKVFLTRLRLLYMSISNDNEELFDNFDSFILRILYWKTTYDKLKEIALIKLKECSSFTSFEVNMVKGLLNVRKDVSEYYDNKVEYCDWFIHQDTNAWEIACETKELLFHYISSSKDYDLRIKLWDILAESHFDWRQAAFISSNSDYKEKYLNELKKDIGFVYKFLSKNITVIENAELMHIRRIWEYLLISSNGSPDFVDLANKCESLYSQKIKCKYYKLFSNSRIEEQDAIIIEIREMFSKASSIDIISHFFKDAWDFLSMNDMTSPGNFLYVSHILSKACFDLYNCGSSDSFSLFIDKGFKSHNNTLLDTFLVSTLRLFIKKFKMEGKFSLSKVKDICYDDKWIVIAYKKGNESNIGTLTNSELNYISEMQINPEDLIELLPVFISINIDDIKKKVEDVFNSYENDLDVLFEKLVESLYNALISLQNTKISGLFIWLINLLSRFNINASIFEYYQFKSIKDICSDVISQDLFAELIEKRVELELSGTKGSNFEIWPSFFQIDMFVSDVSSQSAITRVCKKIIDNQTYLTLYVLPQYLAYMDRDGKIITSFVNDYLHNYNCNTRELYSLASLASGFDDGSQAWSLISKPICDYIENKAIPINKYDLFYYLSPKFDSFSSDEDPFKYENRVEKTRILLEGEQECSSLYAYREWAFNEAKTTLRQYLDIIEGANHE